MLNKTKFIWKPLLRKLITGSWKHYKMFSGEPPFPNKLKNLGLYLHVPFCKNLCPFCPYNRVEYDESLYAKYEKAVHQEIDLYTPYINNYDIVSLYIGGGTPTININSLIGILDHIKQISRSMNDICIELHPSNMDANCLSILKENGISMVSIGVESTQDHLLTKIGRSHDGKTAIESLNRALKTGFKSVNVDLMFTLPGQELKDWENDLKNVLELGVDQVSTYPLFSFPYSDDGIKIGLKKVKRPSEKIIKSMLSLTTNLCNEYGLERVAVWSWLKPNKKKFSSITRHHYIGFGPSAASMIGSHFYVNTFDVNAYASTLPSKRPISLTLEVNNRLEMSYWLYWRVYELIIFNSDFNSLFKSEKSLWQIFKKVIIPFQLIGMIRKTNDGFEITEAGSYWIHRLQNEYSLNYINRLWGISRKCEWPKEVVL